MGNKKDVHVLPYCFKILITNPFKINLHVKVFKHNFIKISLITHLYQYTREEYIISIVIIKLT